MTCAQCGGVQRSMVIFRGTVHGVAVRHALVPLIGRGYRLVVAFQAPTKLATSDASVTALLFELYARRIVLP